MPIPADTGPNGGVGGVAFSPGGTLLASADADGTVRLWNPATHQPDGVPIPAVTGGTGGLIGVAFSPNGTLLATADEDGTVQLWQVAPFAHPYAALCTDVGPPTRQEWNQYAAGSLNQRSAPKRRHAVTCQPDHGKRHLPHAS
jgi:WD40 repeat protein